MKRSLLALTLLCSCSAAFAQAYSNAIQFAQQAGVIGGAAQACSQDITEYNSRVVEAVNTLGADAGDREAAMTAYQKALAEIQYTQMKNHNLNCGQVIQSFQSLPLMQPNYKTVVLPALAAMANGGSATAPNNPVVVNPTTPTTTEPAPTQPATAMSQITTAAAPPTQDYVTGNGQ